MLGDFFKQKFKGAQRNLGNRGQNSRDYPGCLRRRTENGTWDIQCYWESGIIRERSRRPGILSQHV